MPLLLRAIHLRKCGRNQNLGLLWREDLDGSAIVKLCPLNIVSASNLTFRKSRLILRVAHIVVDFDTITSLAEDKFLSWLEDEKIILEAEFNALEVISKAIAQQAANAAIDVIVKAVNIRTPNP